LFYLGFDFGYKRIGAAVGQLLTKTASPLKTLDAVQGEPVWSEITALIKEWNPAALIVGLPTSIDGKKLYTTRAATQFADTLRERFSLPVHLVDERLSTVDAKALLFEQGGYRKIQKTAVDSIAACIILEQWFYETSS